MEKQLTKPTFTIKEFNSLRESGKTLKEVCEYFGVTSNQLTYLRNKESGKKHRVSNVRPTVNDWRSLVQTIAKAIRSEAEELNEKAESLESLLN